MWSSTWNVSDGGFRQGHMVQQQGLHTGKFVGQSKKKPECNFTMQSYVSVHMYVYVLEMFKHIYHKEPLIKVFF